MKTLNENDRQEMIDELEAHYAISEQIDEDMKQDINDEEESIIDLYIADDLDDDLQAAINECEDNDEPYTIKQLRQECIDFFIAESLPHLMEEQLRQIEQDALDEYSIYLSEQTDEDLIDIYNRELG